LSYSSYFAKCKQHQELSCNRYVVLTCD
jgi:hypothetical protein